MKNLSKSTIIACCAMGLSFAALAGNKDRVGQSGASELLINPWARTTGVFGLNSSYVGGIEAMKTNIAGLAADSTMEVGVSHGVYLSGTGININNLALAIPLGKDNVIGFNVMSMNFGDIQATDYFNPEGVGTFRPQFLNVQMGFARQFGTHVHAGAAATYVSEQINNVGAIGLAFDGGVQYVTGKSDNFHLGVSLRNLGTNMRFTGTGFAVNGDQTQSNPTFAVTHNQPSDKFQMPTYLNLGASYDFYLDEHRLASADSAPVHKLTIMAHFTSNSFINDYLGVGAEYTFRGMFMARAAYRYEKGIGSLQTSSTMYQGLAMGASAQSRLGAGGPMLAIDYSYRPTQRPANGVHMFSLRFTLQSVKKDPSASLD